MLCVTGSCFKRNEIFFILRCYDATSILVSENFYFLEPISKSNIRTPKITISDISLQSQKTVRLVIQSTEAAFYIWLETTIGGHFSDNGFHLLPNESRQIIFYGWDNININDFKSTLTYQNLANIYSK